MKQEQLDLIAFAEAHPTGFWRDVVRAAFSLSADTDVLAWIKTHAFNPATLCAPTPLEDVHIECPLYTSVELPVVIESRGYAIWRLDASFAIGAGGYLRDAGNGHVVLDGHALRAALKDAIMETLRERVQDERYDSIEDDEVIERVVDYDADPSVPDGIRYLVDCAWDHVIAELRETLDDELDIS